ncbi:MAG: hypothetical protein Q8L48_19555 [Archangium sp.]|nr:hypothetical protein [Archangium sp.]
MRLTAILIVVALSGCQKPGSVCGGEPPSYVPGPDFACTPQLIGSMVCPRGQVGWGYQCTDAMCWQLFMDGPCAPPFVTADAGPPDAGLPDASTCAAADLCASEGSQQCRNTTQLECRQGCWSPIGTCGFDASVFCQPSFLPAQFDPNGSCTEPIFGASICPLGPGSGYGFHCTDGGCWEAFADGPCVSAGDAGRFCPVTERCSDEGRLECRGGLRSWCTSGCWLDVGLCGVDAGLVCGPSAADEPTAPCLPGLVGTSVCLTGNTAGSSYTCTGQLCWSFNGVCSADAGADGG